jgi:FkbM family methyltransferase
VVARPAQFFWILALKLSPWSSRRPLRLRLKDGKVVVVRGFWTLFLFDEIFIQHCYDAPDVLSGGPYDAVIDIGANIGLFTIRSKQLWPDARILAVEPHPDNFANLLEHIRFNNLSGVTAFAEGVADECGCLELSVSPRNIGGHTMYKKPDSDESISVPVSTLHNLMERAGIGEGRILMKVDCEGCEFPLLNGLNQALASRFEVIIFEPEEDLYSLSALCERMQGLAFAVSRVGTLVLLNRRR